MIEIELKNPTDFYKHKTFSSKEFIKQLKNKYPTEYQKALSELDEYTNTFNIDFKKMLTYEDIIEEIDDIIEDECIINYYVTDTCGTDRGIQHMVIENGYTFKEE